MLRQPATRFPVAGRALIGPGGDASDKEAVLHARRPEVPVKGVLVHLHPEANVQAVLALALDLGAPDTLRGALCGRRP